MKSITTGVAVLGLAAAAWWWLRGKDTESRRIPEEVNRWEEEGGHLPETVENPSDRSSHPPGATALHAAPQDEGPFPFPKSAG